MAVLVIMYALASMTIIKITISKVTKLLKMFTQLDVLIKFLCCVVRSYDTSTKIVANSDLG